MFDCVADLLTREVTTFANNYKEANKDLVLHLVDYLIRFAYTESHMELLKSWLNSDKLSINGVAFESFFLTQDNRFNIVKLLHRSRVIPKEEKDSLLNKEVERDNNSDRSVLAKLACYASLPDKQVKEELWTKFVYQSTSDSLYNMETLMAYFASRDQLDLVEEYLQTKFFEVLIDVGKNNDFFYVRSFVDSLSSHYWQNEETISKLEKLAEKVKELD
jgi:hypothetical protein